MKINKNIVEIKNNGMIKECNVDFSHKKNYFTIRAEHNFSGGGVSTRRVEFIHWKNKSRLAGNVYIFNGYSYGLSSEFIKLCNQAKICAEMTDEEEFYARTAYTTLSHNLHKKLC
jgi:hypothetical protein